MWESQTAGLEKAKGTSVIIFDSDKRVLLYLRDDKPTIPFPDRWDLIGGEVETEETPDMCIARELREELGYDRKEPQLFEIYKFDDRIEYTYCIADTIDVSTTRLYEGQYLRWFSRDEVMQMSDEMFAFGFKRVLEDFYRLQGY